MEGKKYLFVAGIPNEAERFEKVTQAFMRKALFTDSVLFVVLDATFEAVQYKQRVSSATWGGGEHCFHLQRRRSHFAIGKTNGLLYRGKR